MRFLILFVSLAIIFGCKNDTGDISKSKEIVSTIPVDKKADSTQLMQHKVPHYIKYRLFNNEENTSAKTEKFELELQSHQLINPTIDVNYIKSKKFANGDTINLCKNFLLSNDDGKTYRKTNFIEFAKPIYNRPSNNGQNISISLLGTYGCGPGLYFEDSSDPKFVLTRIKNGGKIMTCLPVPMALHGKMHKTEYDLSPTYFNIINNNLKEIKAAIKDKKTLIGTGKKPYELTINGNKFMMLKDLIMCEDDSGTNCDTITTTYF